MSCKSPRAASTAAMSSNFCLGLGSFRVEGLRLNYLELAQPPAGVILIKPSWDPTMRVDSLSSFGMWVRVIGLKV